MTKQSRELWHLHKVIVPRRSITGRLLWGTTWRRRCGRKWIYKKFVPSAADMAKLTLSRSG